MTGRFALVGMRRVNWSQLIEQLVIYRIRRNSRTGFGDRAGAR